MIGRAQPGRPPARAHRPADREIPRRRPGLDPAPLAIVVNFDVQAREAAGTPERTARMAVAMDGDAEPSDVQRQGGLHRQAAVFAAETDDMIADGCAVEADLEAVLRAVGLQRPGGEVDRGLWMRSLPRPARQQQRRQQGRRDQPSTEKLDSGLISRRRE